MRRLILVGFLLGVFTCKSNYKVREIIPDNVLAYATIELSGDTVSESGERITATIALHAEPTDKVIFSIGAVPEGKIVIDPPQLEFTPENWATAQTVTLVGQANDIEDFDVVVNVSFDPSQSLDARYKARNPYTTAITVTNAPAKPVVTRTDRGWKWSSSGGGTRTFIYTVDDPDIENGTRTTDLEILPTLARGVHVIRIAELDSQGNMSAVVTEIILVDSPITPLPQTGDTDGRAEATPLVKNVLTLSGPAPSHIPGVTPEFSWLVVSAPDGSTATFQSDATTDTPTFVPDRPGTYVFERTVTFEGQQVRTIISVIVEGYGAATLVRSSPTGDHSCAIASGSKVYCWGANDRFQLGKDFAHGGTDSHNHQNSLRPELVLGLTGTTDLALGAAHTCALGSGGTVSCWGDHSYLQLGGFNGGTRSTTPQTIAGISGAVALAAGKYHTCAVLSNKTVKCWGEGSQGELGHGSSADSATPVAVNGISTAKEIGCGTGFCCARLGDKTVSCWGRGDLGQLGNGGTANSNVPVQATGLSGVTSLAVGDSHACAVTEVSQVLCWGQSGKHQLGNGSTTNALVPTRVTNY